MKTAGPIVAALTRTQWTLLTAVATLTDERAERARALLDQLADAAQRDQFQSDLVAALDSAVKAASELLAAAVTVTIIDKPGRTDDVTVTVSSARGEKVVADAGDVAAVADEIGKALSDHPGKRVRVTWRVEP
jgi:hypothetical protein